MKYQEKAVCVLSELENANFLGRLLSHFDELKKQLKDKPKVYAELCKALETYQGPVTESALNPCPNHWQSNPTAFLHAQALVLLSSSPLSSPSPLQEVEDTLCNAADHIEDNLRAQLDNQKPKWIYTCPHAPCKCFKCGQPGHIYS
jgi:hypothetical protein